MFVALACSEKSVPREPKASVRTRRTPPSSMVAVRALPPHAIRSDGVGPYLIGRSVSEALRELPSGPRLSLYEIPGIVQQSIVRAENGAILVGGVPRGLIQFVAFVSPDVARTERGVMVGRPETELVGEIGPLLNDEGEAADPRLRRASKAPGVRWIIENGLVVAGVALGTREPLGKPRSCPEHIKPNGPLQEGEQLTCLTDGGEVVRYTRDGVVVRGLETGRNWEVRMPGVAWAAPLRVDGRDELVVLHTQREPHSITWSMVALRWEAGRVVRSVDQVAFLITAEQVKWIGTDLGALDLLIKVEVQDDALAVGGFLLVRQTGTPGSSVKELLPLNVQMLPRRKGRPDGPPATP